MLAWALTLQTVTLRLDELMVAMMWAISSLFGWLCCVVRTQEGGLMWFGRRYMLLRLSVFRI